MPYTTYAKNFMLTALRADITEISLHTGDPSTTGANEVTGGGYTRASVTTADFAAAASGEVTLADDIAFVGPASGNCTHFGLWDGTDFVGGGAITGDTTFNAEGDFNLLAATKFDLNG
jgi:hypothetical protein